MGRSVVAKASGPDSFDEPVTVTVGKRSGPSKSRAAKSFQDAALFLRLTTWRQESSKPGSGAFLEHEGASPGPEHTVALPEQVAAQVGTERPQEAVPVMEDDRVERGAVEGEHPDREDAYVNEDTGLVHGLSRLFGCSFVGKDHCGQACDSGLRRERSGDGRVVQADLEHPFTQPHSAHTHRERYATNRRLTQKHAHFLMI